MTLAKVSIDTHSIKPNEAHHLYPLVHQTSQALSCPPFGFQPHPQYDWGHSTEDNYRSEERKFFGKFQKIRQRLDYEYHANYSRGRQRLQDSIIDYLLSSTGRERNTPSTPWIIFTAGVMGAGKTHTIKHLHANGKFPLESFVSVDPDEIRRLLPEFHDYVKKCPEKAGRFTRKEAGMITEILTKAALESGKNVSVDGSLRDAIWYRNYFVSLRNTYPAIKLGIIHVTAPMEAILQRVEERAKTTGRVVPKEVLLNSFEQVPKSVEILSQHVDLFLTIHNAPKINDSTKAPQEATESDIDAIPEQKCV